MKKHKKQRKLKTLKDYSLFTIHYSLSLGQTLVELLVTLGVATLFVVTLVSLSTGALGNINFSRAQGDGNRHAREAIEWLRAERDQNWAAFSSRSSAEGTTWCLQTLAWPAGSGACGSITVPNTNFVRQVTLTSSGASKIYVSVNVAWTDSRGTHNAQLNSILTKWK